MGTLRVTNESEIFPVLSASLVRQVRIACATLLRAPAELITTVTVTGTVANPSADRETVAACSNLLAGEYGFTATVIDLTPPSVSVRIGRG
jgi:hypothetical protein